MYRQFFNNGNARADSRVALAPPLDRSAYSQAMATDFCLDPTAGLLCKLNVDIDLSAGRVAVPVVPVPTSRPAQIRPHLQAVRTRSSSLLGRCVPGRCSGAEQHIGDLSDQP